MTNQQWPEGQHSPQPAPQPQAWNPQDQQIPGAQPEQAWQPQDPQAWAPQEQQQTWPTQDQQAWPPQDAQAQAWQAQPQGGWQQPMHPGQPQGFPAPAPSKPSPFDFGFKALSLPGSAGLIFLLGTIGLGVEWLVGLIQVLSDVVTYGVSAFSVLGHLLGGLSLVLVKVLVLRVLIEIGVAVTKLLARSEDE